MATKLRGGGNSLIDIDYGDLRTLKSLLKNWSGLEALSDRGDRVATCILMDLKEVTGLPTIYRNMKDIDTIVQTRGYSTLTEEQFVSVVYVLILGYTPKELSFICGKSRQAVESNIEGGLKRIAIALEQED